MDQRILFNFDIKKDNNYFTFSVLPGTSFDDIDAVLIEFQQTFKDLRAQYAAKEAEKKAQETKDVPSEEAPVEEVLAEVV